ncbi:ABC transporter ATP-binding protein [soil metagenome]
MISIDKISKRFRKTKALSDLEITFLKDHVYALIGPNGSGKTTLIKSILGLVIPDSGEITVDNEPTRNSWKYREKIGYMPQIGRFPDNMKIGQLIDMIQNIRKSKNKLDEDLIDSFHLKSMYDKRMHTLSGGTRQKVSASLAFLYNPPILILDEPTAGLDPVSVEIVKEKIIEEKAKGKLIIISSHIMSDLDDLVSDLIYLYEGKILYENSIEALKSSTSESRLGKAISKMIKNSI